MQPDTHRLDPVTIELAHKLALALEAAEAAQALVDHYQQRLIAHMRHLDLPDQPARLIAGSANDFRALKDWEDEQ